MNSLTDYLNTPLTQDLAQRYGAKLETLTAPDKLAIAQLILTTIAWNDVTDGPELNLVESADEHGVVYPDAPYVDAFIDVVEHFQPSIEDRLAIAAALCHQLHKGVYSDDKNEQ